VTVPLQVTGPETLLSVADISHPKFALVDAIVSTTLPPTVMLVADGVTVAVGNGAAVTVIENGVDDLLVSSVDVAVTVAVPVPEGVNTPAEVMVPPVAVHETRLSVLPSLFLTVPVQADVCAALIGEGQLTVTEVTVTVCAVTVIANGVDDMLVFSVDVATTPAAPAPEGANIPEEVMVPPVAVHVTELSVLPSLFLTTPVH